MSGHHPFRELTKDFPPERQARIADKVRLLKQDMALAELRQARQQSQADLAARLQVHPPAIAKMERRTDMYVSNLRRCIAAMGGTLEIVAHFPEGSVTITNFSEVDTVESPEHPCERLGGASPWPRRLAAAAGRRQSTPRRTDRWRRAGKDRPGA